jgi:hypothetical protein
VTASLPDEVQRVFDRFITTEYTTVDRKGQPITWPVTPYYRPGDPCIDVTTGVGYPKKAADAEANPKVALLFSDPTGSGVENPPQVLVQGTAQVNDDDLEATAERYARESVEKLPATKSMLPPKPLRGMLGWYFKRLYVSVRPERVYIWPDGDPGREPQLLDAHLEEVRSGHDEEPAADHAGAAGGEPVWDGRMDELGDRYKTAVLSLVAPDGFPFSVRLPIEVDRDAHRIRFGGAPLAIPLQAGLACVTAHDHHPEFTWQRNFQVRGDLVQEDDAWALVPHKMVGGFELPPTSMLARYKLNFQKMRRFRKIAKREIAKREG